MSVFKSSPRGHSGKVFGSSPICRMKVAGMLHGRVVPAGFMAHRVSIDELGGAYSGLIKSCA